MGLSSKQVISSEGLDWSKTLLQELPKPPILRRLNQQNPSSSSASSPSPSSTTEPLKCPRCDSTNTKFCYYNNYNKSQPRHFCKACKRHWTKGGTLRNVPVGGGRKNKCLKTASKLPAAATTTTTTTTTSSNGNFINRVNPHMVIQAQQLKQNLPLDQKISILEQNNSISFFSSSSSALLSLPHQNQNYGLNLQFPYSNLETTPSSISTSFQSSYNIGDQAMEDSTITNVLPATTTQNQLWQIPNASYWNWEEDIDNFVPTDLNLPWDDHDSKL